ncbi:MAG: o-succinylbenzoate--CoA ligase [Anaerolineales bacterium]|nr:o-succinylbenzoate--CoA ligase [Anaerolineales bacterium]
METVTGLIEDGGMSDVSGTANPPALEDLAQPAHWLAEQARQRPDAPAVITRDATLTYAALEARVAVWAAELAGRGVMPGEPVAAWLPLTIESVVIVHAVARAGAVLVPLNTRLTTDEIAWQIRHVGARFVIIAGEPAPVLPDGVAVVKAGARSDFSPASSLLPLPSSLQAIVFTSGTSGRPRGALLSFANHFWSAMASALRIGTLPGDRWLCPLPLYHVGGLAIVWRSCLYGTALVLATSSRVEDLAQDLRDQAATLVSLVPTQLQRLLDHDAEALHGVRLVLLGGAAATPELMARAQAAGVRVAPTYGLTETASQIATQRPEDALRKPGSVGKALPWSRIRVLAEDGTEAPIGTPGEIVIAGPTVFRGYWRDSAATAAALRDDALHTGDIGYVDAEGDLWVLQRRTDLIVSGGENVYPAEVEAVLAAHPAVSMACVVGLPDPEWGQRVAAAVVVRAGATLTETELIDFARSSLAGYKQPRRVRFLEALPMTASGKVLRRAVAELVLAGDA